MRVLFDMDGVVAEWDTEYDRCLDEVGTRAAGIPRRPDRTGWDLHEGRTAEESAIIKTIMEKPGFYAALRPVPGAREAVREVIAMGHDVRFVTSPWASNATCASDKLEWIRRVFGREMGRRVVITSDKTVVDGDVLIDDKPSVHGDFVPTWEHVLFTQPYNVGVTGRRRIANWTDGSWRSVLTPPALFLGRAA